MKLLLDTHTLLWFIAGDSRLSQTARTLIEDATQVKHVSAASLWVTAIKISIGKMSLATTFEQLFRHQLTINGFTFLPIEIKLASALITLPFHHRDPFDRIIIAQATEENMKIVSVDAAFDDYSVTRLW
jgi:PIN domain nuclease of toxin-antitoxin system